MKIDNSYKMLEIIEESRRNNKETYTIFYTSFLLIFFNYVTLTYIYNKFLGKASIIGDIEAHKKYWYTRFYNNNFKNQKEFIEVRQNLRMISVNHSNKN